MLPRRFAVAFALAGLGGLFAHEFGHALAAWVQGIGAVPTPAKAYLLRDVTSPEQAMVSLGGVAGGVVALIGTLLWYARTTRSGAEAVLAGVMVAPLAYSVRYLLAGRGHDGLEWQEAQTALGAARDGHLVDLVFLGLLLAGGAAWVVGRRGTLDSKVVARAAGLMVGGVLLLAFLQAANNAVFDPMFPKQ